MALIWLGALLILGGVVLMAFQAIWRGPLSSPGRRQAPVTGATLEPPQRGIVVFSLSRNWPGLALIALGVVLLLAAALTDNRVPSL